MLPVLGIYVKRKNDFTNVKLVQETYIKGYYLSNETHAEIFNILSYGCKIVKLERIMPYLMIFFLASHYNEIEKRKTRFFQMLDPRQNKDGQMSII